MTAEEYARKLIRMGKKGYAANYQDNQFMRQAGELILRLLDKVSSLTETVYTLEERLAIREEAETDADGVVDDFPPDTDCLDVTAPGEAAEDFWGDDWPLEP